MGPKAETWAAVAVPQHILASETAWAKSLASTRWNVDGRTATTARVWAAWTAGAALVLAVSTVAAKAAAAAGALALRENALVAALGYILVGLLELCFRHSRLRVTVASQNSDHEEILAVLLDPCSVAATLLVIATMPTIGPFLPGSPDRQSTLYCC